MIYSDLTVNLNCSNNIGKWLFQHWYSFYGVWVVVKPKGGYVQTCGVEKIYVSDISLDFKCVFVITFIYIFHHYWIIWHTVWW